MAENVIQIKSEMQNCANMNAKIQEKVMFAKKVIF